MPLTIDDIADSVMRGSSDVKTMQALEDQIYASIVNPEVSLAAGMTAVIGALARVMAETQQASAHMPQAKLDALMKAGHDLIYKQMMLRVAIELSKTQERH
jgi:hypothetical protein